MSDDLISKRELEQYLTSRYRMERFKEIIFETKKAIRSELPKSQTMTKVLLSLEDFKALEEDYYGTVGVEHNGGDATATLFGVPIDIDVNIESGQFGFVIEMKI